MIASVAETVTSGPLLVAAPLAAAAGLISFLSPCILPLVPGYLGFVTGLSGAELADGQPRRGGAHVLAGSSLFVLGFSAVFVSLGAAFGGLGQLLQEHETTLQQVFGVLTILLGLAFTGLLARVPLLEREFRFHRLPRAGVLGAPLLGFMFGLGWTPCIGPTLSAVLGLAASTDGTSAWRGALLALVYCLGLGLPFLLCGLLFDQTMVATRWVKRHYRVVMVSGGSMLVVVGLAEVTGVWARLVAELQTSAWSVNLPI